MLLLLFLFFNILVMFISFSVRCFGLGVVYHSWFFVKFLNYFEGEKPDVSIISKHKGRNTDSLSCTQRHSL